MVTYQATTEKYDASDGLSADVGSLDIRNALVVSDDGVDGNLIFTVVNTSADDAELAIQFEGDSGRTTSTLDVPGNSTVVLGGEEEPILLEGIGTIPGSLLPVYFQTGDSAGEQLTLPVLDGGLPEYSAFVP